MEDLKQKLEDGSMSQNKFNIFVVEKLLSFTINDPPGHQLEL